MELYLPVFAALMVTVFGCSAPGRDGPDPPLEEKVFKSDYVVYGTMLDKKADPVYKANKVYAAVISVKCTYKGGELPANITVVGAGQMKKCQKASLQKMEDYILLLKMRPDNYYDIEFSQLPGDPQEIDEILIVCGLALTYTKGSKAEMDDECPEVFEDAGDDCLQYTTPKPIKNTTVPVVNPKDEVTTSHKYEVITDGNKEIDGKGSSQTKDNGNGKDRHSLSIILLSTCTILITLLV